jgi:hypothetical protein
MRWVALPQHGNKLSASAHERRSSGSCYSFMGSGDKYARNIWMDVYDEDFRNAIAVDERIKAVTRALGFAFKRYRDHEAFYCSVATEAGLEPWELDRCCTISVMISCKGPQTGSANVLQQSSPQPLRF